MLSVANRLARTLFAFAVSLCAICLPCGETLVPLLLQGARTAIAARFRSPGGPA